MTHIDYWSECIINAADEGGFKLTPSQVQTLALAVEAGHDNYGQCFYSPPAGDMVYHAERESEKKYKALEREFEKYRGNAETAVKQALNQRADTQVGIGEYGEVTRYGGRTERIQ
jgi:hypothetical protein